MPITKSAKKSLKVARTQTSQNKIQEVKLSKAIKNANEKELNKAVSVIDKSAKIGIIKKNKAARLKSKLMKKFKKENAESQKLEVKTKRKKIAIKKSVK